MNSGIVNRRIKRSRVPGNRDSVNIKGQGFRDWYVFNRGMVNGTKCIFKGKGNRFNF